jgi:hypothetical protein
VGGQVVHGGVEGGVASPPLPLRGVVVLGFFFRCLRRTCKKKSSGSAYREKWEVCPPTPDQESSHEDCIADCSCNKHLKLNPKFSIAEYPFDV